MAAWSFAGPNQLAHIKKPANSDLLWLYEYSGSAEPKRESTQLK